MHADGRNGNDCRSKGMQWLEIRILCSCDVHCSVADYFPCKFENGVPWLALFATGPMIKKDVMSFVFLATNIQQVTPVVSQVARLGAVCPPPTLR